MRQAGIFWRIQVKVSLGHAVFLGIGGFTSQSFGGAISTALIGGLGLTRMPIGALWVLIQVLYFWLGGLVSAGIGCC